MSLEHNNLLQFGYDHFANYQQANQVGCFDNDVQWSGRDFYDYDFSHLEDFSYSYFEWTGH